MALISLEKSDHLSQKYCLIIKSYVFKQYSFISQGVLDSISEGQNKLDAACKEGESLYGCLPKPIVSHMQEQIAKSNQNFQEFLNQCLNDKKALEACASHLGRWVIPAVTNRLHEIVWLPKCRAKWIISNCSSPICFFLWKYLREIEVPW